MSDGTKITLAMIGLVTIFIVGSGVLIWHDNTYRAELRQAACVNPETVACALAVRR
jgi:hypothetical protein